MSDKGKILSCVATPNTNILVCLHMNEVRLFFDWIQEVPGAKIDKHRFTVTFPNGSYICLWSSQSEPERLAGLRVDHSFILGQVSDDLYTMIKYRTYKTTPVMLDIVW